MARAAFKADADGTRRLLSEDRGGGGWREDGEGGFGFLCRGNGDSGGFGKGGDAGALASRGKHDRAQGGDPNESGGDSSSG